MQAWRKNRSNRKAGKRAFLRIVSEPEKRLARLVATTGLWLVDRRMGGYLGKGFRVLLNAYAPLSTTPKALTFKLRSIRRYWGSTLTVGIRVKW
jgi:hypothetical protein